MPQTEFNRRKVFQDIYKDGLWGRDAAGEKFYSGSGSRGEGASLYLEVMQEELKHISSLLGRGIKLVDVGCGDFAIGQELVRRVEEIDEYVGCDVVPELIEHHQKKFGSAKVKFKKLDVVEELAPASDVCLVRQVFQHLSNADVLCALNNLNSPLTFISEGQPRHRVGPINPDKPTNSDVRFDWKTGKGRGLELNKPPFNCQIEELCYVPVYPAEIVITYRLTR